MEFIHTWEVVELEVILKKKYIYIGVFLYTLPIVIFPNLQYFLP